MTKRRIIMKIMELSQELGVTNKEMITFLKEQGFQAKSHLQVASNEMIEAAKDKFEVKKKTPKKESKKVEKVENVSKPETNPVTIKHFDPDDLIACKSITPWKLVEIGVDKNTVYRWGGYGDVEYVPYRDLQSWRRKPIIKEGRILIDDPDICYLWKKEVGQIYDYFLNVEYPEEFFDMPDDVFEKLLTDAPETIQEVLKYTAIDMIHNTNYPPTQKIVMMDNILNTCIKEFL